MDTSTLILLGVFVVLLALNVPVAFCIGLASLAALVSLGDLPAATLFAQRLTSGMDSFALLAIPFFILSGQLMGRGGMARRLIDFSGALVGHLPGGLGLVNILTCMMFGSISGSAAAAVSSVGGFMLPEMNRKGYAREFNVAVTATAATTGLLIPPSNIMIVYALATGKVSIAALFMAGILPGIAVGACLMAACLWISLKRGYRGEAWAGWGQVGRGFLEALPSLLMIILVLGGILGGVFTATEAAAFAVVYSFIVTVVFYREVKLRDLPRLLTDCGVMTAVVMLLVGACSGLSWYLAYSKLPQTVSMALIEFATSPWALLISVNLLLLIVGTFMDITPAVLILAPILLPAMEKIGLHPIHFGIMMIANLNIGLCTPPVGTCLFLGSSIGGTSIARTARAMLPFFGAMIVAQLLITFLPALSLWIPKMLKLI